MIYKDPKRGSYRIKFRWQGRIIQKRTRATSARQARAIEAKLRAELAQGNFGILEKKPAPTLKEFLEREFKPYIQAKFQSKPSSARYYEDGVKRLLASDVAQLPIDRITDREAREFEARWAFLAAATVNCGLRTLRRALSLAAEWGKLERRPKIALAKGERQRDRVLAQNEAERYLAACPQAWRDVATIMLGTGMRPGEVYKMRWEHVLLNGSSGMIQIAEGKSRAARRLLPMVPAVYQALKARHESQGCPVEGWVFPTGSRSGHLEESVAKKGHAKALDTLAKAHKEKPDSNLEIKRFEPYCLRHTALTWLAESGCDAFTLARIAGHSSIIVTQRYCHPQAEAVEAAFTKLAAGQRVVPTGGSQQNATVQLVSPNLAVVASPTRG